MSDRFTVEYDHTSVNPATRVPSTTHYALTIHGKQYATNAVMNLKANRFVSNVVMQESEDDNAVEQPLGLF